MGDSCCGAHGGAFIAIVGALSQESQGTPGWQAVPSGHVADDFSWSRYCDLPATGCCSDLGERGATNPANPRGSKWKYVPSGIGRDESTSEGAGSLCLSGRAGNAPVFEGGYACSHLYFSREFSAGVGGTRASFGCRRRKNGRWRSRPQGPRALSRSASCRGAGSF